MALSLIFPKRHRIALQQSDLIYDPERQINMVKAGGHLCVAIDQPMLLPTNSKTFAEPGDDDQDDDNIQLM